MGYSILIASVLSEQQIAEINPATGGGRGGGPPHAHGGRGGGPPHAHGGRGGGPPHAHLKPLPEALADQEGHVRTFCAVALVTVL